MRVHTKFLIRSAQVSCALTTGLLAHRAAEQAVQGAFRRDLTGERERVIEQDPNWVTYKRRQPEGNSAARAVALGGGFGAATLGGIMIRVPEGRSLLHTGLREGVCLAMIGAGLGVVAAAQYMSLNYAGAEVRPVE